MAHVAIFPLEGIDPALVLGMVLTKPKHIEACCRARGVRVVDSGVHWNDPAYWVPATDLEYFGAEDCNTHMNISKDADMELKNDISALERYMSERHYQLLFVIWDGWHAKTTCRFGRLSSIETIDELPAPEAAQSADRHLPSLFTQFTDEGPLPATSTESTAASSNRAESRYPPAPTVETIYTDEDLDLATDSLHPAVAVHAVMLTPFDAEIAEQAFEVHGDAWFEMSNVFDERGFGACFPIHSLSDYDLLPCFDFQCSPGGLPRQPPPDFEYCICASFMMVNNNTEAFVDTAQKPPSSPDNLTSEDGSATPENAPLTITTAPSGGRRANRKKAGDAEDDEPLIDLTARLELRSKKTSRLKKRQNKKLSKPKKSVSNLLDLPTELLQEVLAHLRPSDVFVFCRVSQSTRAFIQQNESTLAREIISARYSMLSRCFPLPVLFSTLPETVHAALLSPKRQEMLTIHKKPYQHVQGMDPHQICTCMTCVFAWNNLCMIVDLAHWQKSLDRREPIPMIGRGQTPDWNQQLIAENAKIVERALTSPLLHAAILERHLRTTSSTILRRSKYIKQRPVLPEHRAYQLSYAESEEESDAFLARKGPPSYEFPYHRDNYYNVEAYVPNRKWSKDEEKWLYYHSTQHERDLEWVVARFGPEEDGEKVGRRVAELSKRLQGGLIAY